MKGFRQQSDVPPGVFKASFWLLYGDGFESETEGRREAWDVCDPVRA